MAGSLCENESLSRLRTNASDWVSDTVSILVATEAMTLVVPAQAQEGHRSEQWTASRHDTRDTVTHPHSGRG